MTITVDCFWLLRTYRTATVLKKVWPRSVQITRATSKFASKHFIYHILRYKGIYCTVSCLSLFARHTKYLPAQPPYWQLELMVVLVLVVPLAALADWQACASVSWLSSGGQIARLDHTYFWFDGVWVALDLRFLTYPDTYIHVQSIVLPANERSWRWHWRHWYLLQVAWLCQGLEPVIGSKARNRSSQVTQGSALLAHPFKSQPWSTLRKWIFKNSKSIWGKVEPKVYNF